MSHDTARDILHALEERRTIHAAFGPLSVVAGAMCSHNVFVQQESGRCAFGIVLR